MNYTTEVKMLERWFDATNYYLYDNELEKPVITYSPDPKGKSYGWFTTYKAWKQGEQESYEINISANLERKATDILATLMHEMAHLYNKMHDLKDCSRGGTYHNRQFKDTAEKHGLTVEQDKKYGWTKTAIRPELADWAEQITAEYKMMHRTEPTNGTETKKRTSYKHVCPCCGAIARTTKRISLICGDCYTISKIGGTEPHIIEMEIED